MDIYYTVNGSELMSLPSTGNMGYLGKQSTAKTQEEAEAKIMSVMNQNRLNLPAGAVLSKVRKQGTYFVAEFKTGMNRNGGKPRKSRRGVSKSRSRRKKTRKSVGNKSRRSPM